MAAERATTTTTVPFVGGTLTATTNTVVATGDDGTPTITNINRESTTETLSGEISDAQQGHTNIGETSGGTHFAFASNVYSTDPTRDYTATTINTTNDQHYVFNRREDIDLASGENLLRGLHISSNDRGYNSVEYTNTDGAVEVIHSNTFSGLDLL